MNRYNIDFFYMHLFTMRNQCVLNRSSNQDAHYSCPRLKKNTSLKLPVGVSPLQLVDLHRHRRYFVKTMCEVLWRNISDFYVNLRVEVATVSRNRYGVEKTVDTHKILINCLSSRNMTDKTMCEVLWRNISDVYVNLRVEVGKHPQVILAMYFFKFINILWVSTVFSTPYLFLDTVATSTRKFT
jgi:hypothetical protein